MANRGPGNLSTPPQLISSNLIAPPLRLQLSSRLLLKKFLIPSLLRPPQVSALLLKEYRGQFKGAPLTSTYRFLAQLVSSSMPSNPLITYDTDVRCGESGERSEHVSLFQAA